MVNKVLINRPFYPLSRVENREEFEEKPENVYTNIILNDHSQ